MVARWGPTRHNFGDVLFLILINAAGFKGMKRNTGQIITQPGINKRKPVEKIHMKFIDDMTIAESILLKDKLVKDPNPEQPLNYHGRTEHTLSPTKLKVQTLLNELGSYAQKHEMKINHKKTKAILFNNAVKYDFIPYLTIDGAEVELVEEIRLLGIQVRADLSWSSNTLAMCQNAYARLWMLRRLKPLGASTTDLLEVYDKQIRCMVEYGSPVWTSGMTKAENNQLERVQKAAFAIILDLNYTSYAGALKYLDRTTLSERRQGINLKFAKMALKSEKFNHWFCKIKPTEQVPNTRSRSVNTNVLVPVEARTKGFKNSPIAYLTRLINDDI